MVLLTADLTEAKGQNPTSRLASLISAKWPEADRKQTSHLHPLWARPRQGVPYANSAPLTVKLLKDGTFKTYKDLPHGLCQTHPEIVNPEILAFIRGEASKTDEQAATAA